ncbi:MAG: hypothetical protein ACAI38_24560 [Myxococcota bacterium]
MAQFEVLIPRSEATADITLVVDVRQDGIAVSDANTGRAFTVRERKAKAAAPPPPPVPAKPDVMSELFHEAGRIYDHKSAKAAAELVLDLAMKAIQAESGAVYISNINRQDLHVLAARGAAAPSLAASLVAMGKGTVGLAAQEGVAIARGNGEACSPVQHDGRVYGVIQLLNKKDAFKAEDMGALDYLAGQLAEYLFNTGQTDA